MCALSILAVSETVRAIDVTVDAGTTVASCRRADLLGINIAVYNQPDDFRKAVAGPLAELDIGLIRMPGGSASDKYYWNGNGVLNSGKIDSTRFVEPYWQVDYSQYHPGFTVDSHDWGKASPVKMDARTMHEITREHPHARNMVTVNAGTGSPELAAEWVRWANIENDYDVKYWEIGNELNGSWEAGHIRPDGSKMTAEKYVEIYVAFAKAMKAVDPSIKIGGPSCDVRHHEDYFEPLLRLAGEHVDFLTLHYYSLRSSLAPESELFDGLSTLTPFMTRIDELVAKYQPDRKDEIEVSVTEWNSKLPKDQDAYRLFNGLWFSAWIGQMMQLGVDSATVWDMFSGRDNGHGMLVKCGDDYVPTGRYWAFWLWSHYMADTMVKTAVTEDPDVHVYSTRDKSTLYVMMMNESRTNSCPVTLNLNGFSPAKAGKEVTLSSREYFWNPYAGKADWNAEPTIERRPVHDGMTVEIPPYCVKVIQFDRAGLFRFLSRSPRRKTVQQTDPTLRILLPERWPCDLEVEGWVRAFQTGSENPSSDDLGSVNLACENGAQLGPGKIPLPYPAGRFVLQPKGPGSVTVFADTGNGLMTTRTIEFTPVELKDRVVWKFQGPKIDQPVESVHAYTSGAPAPDERKALQIDFPNVTIDKNNNHIFAIQKIPNGIPKERIGGVVFDIFLPDDLEITGPPVEMQVIMQSTGAYWIPCGAVAFGKGKGVWRTVRLEIPDKKFLQVMDRAFSLRFIVGRGSTIKGAIYIDNVGFLLRNP